VVERLVKEAGLDVDCRGDTLVLWKKADDALLKKLTETAKANGAGERREAVRELGTLWDRRIYPVLFAALDDRDDDVVQTAVSALRAHAKTLRYADNLAQGTTAILKQWEKARPQQANPHSGIGGREWDLMTLASATGDKRVVDALLPVFRDVNTMRASCAMGALTDFDDPRPVSEAIELQKGGDQSVKFAALRLLYSSKDPNAQAAFEEAVKGGGWIEKSTAVGACMAATPPKMDALLELLKNGDFQTRRSALYSLSNVYDPRLIDMLQEWSRQGDKNQYYAINVLGTYREERVVTGLLALLNTGGVRVQASLATALGKLADPRAVEPLAALTKSAESGVAKAALGGLIRIGDAKAEEVLLGMLRDPQTRQTVAQSLAGDRLADSIVAKALKDCDAPTRICLIRELGNSRKQVWLPAVADCLKDGDPEVKRTVQIALGRLYSGPAAAAILSSMLKDPDPQVRIHLADVLSLAYDSSAVEMLTALLKDADPEVRLAAVGALGGGGALAEARAKRLNEPKPDGMMGMMGMMHGFPQMDLSRIRTLVAALSDADPRVQAAAAEAVGNAYVNGKQELIRPMLKDAKPRVRELALKALGSAAEDEDFAQVLTLLSDNEATVAAAAAEALGKVRLTKPEAVFAVQSLLKFDKEAVRLAAIKCLGLSFMPEAVDAAISVLDEPDAKMRKCAIEVLAPSWNPKSVAAVTRFLKDPDEGLRSAAFDGLLRSNCDAAVDALIALLTDNDAKLRETTAAALKKRLDEHQKTKGAVYPGDDKIKQALDRMSEKPNAGEF
jgi:HEAT repeat protein